MLNLGQRIILAITIVVVGATLTFAFLPLPGQSFGGEPATCGPGSSSSSAVYVKLFPDQVMTLAPGESAALTEGQRAAVTQWIDHCQGVANNRLWTVGIVAAVAAMLGAIVIVVIASPRRIDVAPSPGQPAPTS